MGAVQCQNPPESSAYQKRFFWGVPWGCSVLPGENQQSTCRCLLEEGPALRWAGEGGAGRSAERPTLGSPSRRQGQTARAQIPTRALTAEQP